MASNRVNDCGLNGNTLKIIAAVSMLLDHMGIMLLPDLPVLRVLGRIAFPIYAFMIAEGCAYTKNRLRYFLSVFVLGAVCQTVYYFFDGSMEMGILITFSLSILAIYAMQYLKEALLTAERSRMKPCVALLAFCLVIAGIYLICVYFDIDYGFWGCMAPAFASLFRKPRSSTLALWERLDSRILHVLMLGLCLIIISCVSGGRQPYSLLAIPLLMLYSGRRGRSSMKYFFYIFYPAHLLVLECI